MNGLPRVVLRPRETDLSVYYRSNPQVASRYEDLPVRRDLDRPKSKISKGTWVAIGTVGVAAAIGIGVAYYLTKNASANQLVPCSSSNPCSTGYTCISGVCQPNSTGGGCNPPCSSTQVCSGGQCVSAGGTPSSVRWNGTQAEVHYRVCQPTTNYVWPYGTDCCESRKVCSYMTSASGTALDVNGNPVPNAILIIATAGVNAATAPGFIVTDQNGNAMTQVNTDASGNFTIYLMPNDTPGTDCSGKRMNTVIGPVPEGYVGLSQITPSPLQVVKKEYWCEYNLNAPACPSNCSSSDYCSTATTWDQKC